jgi:hypothetical protein
VDLNATVGEAMALVAKETARTRFAFENDINVSIWELGPLILQAILIPSERTTLL